MSSLATNEPQPQIETTPQPKPQKGNEPAVLTSIYEDDINIAVWQRQQKPELEQYATQWCKEKASHSPRVIIPAEAADEKLETLLPEFEHKQDFKEDLVLLVDMFACLFEAKEVGLRLTPLAKAMCPRFHVDNIPCRLVTTYGGQGTEWLLEENLDRSRLGRGANGLPDHESGIYTHSDAIQQVNAQEIALLKGSGWFGNDAHGLVHRSPALEAGETRLLLTLDCSE